MECSKREECAVEDLLVVKVPEVPMRLGPICVVVGGLLGELVVVWTLK